LEQPLIDEVRGRPAIWDMRHDYKNSVVRTKDWVQLAGILGEEAPSLKQTWTKLRQQYMAFLKRLAKPSGSDGRRPTFRHEREMAFLQWIVPSGEENFSNIDDEGQDEESQGVEDMEEEEGGGLSINVSDLESGEWTQT